ncbi:MAG TPA: hypothetical protein VD967_00435 [Candidatus Paceibacterota bacterium]|nr:hypothetical protein [Candidatus Paceibacterota bacterium]
MRLSPLLTLLLALALAAQGASSASAAQPTAAAKRTQAKQALAPKTFPSAAIASARGGPWKKMHEHGNLADDGTNCRLMRLSSRDCTTYLDMVRANKCYTTEVPNGVVLDFLTFTHRVTGEHKAQRHVLVALENPETREVSVCEIRRGLFVGQFKGCKNHYLVDLRPKSPPPRRAQPLPRSEVPRWATCPQCTS